MARRIATYYWFFMVLLQATIIIRKITTDDGYFLNAAVLIGSLFFVINRLFKNKVAPDRETQLAAFIGIYAATTFIAQLIRFTDEKVALASLIVFIASFFIAYHIWKTESKNKANEEAYH